MATPATVNAPVMTYSAPITISKGGTYKGAWASGNRNPAINITTTEPVIIEDSAVQGFHHLIVAVAGADVTIRNSFGQGLWTSVDGSNYGRMFYCSGNIKRFIFENNDFIRCAGVKLEKASPQTVKIRYNRARDIFGDAYNNGGGGYMQFAQLAAVVGPDIEIAWNEVYNRPNFSRTEDVISLFGGTSGTGATTPLKIHDNLIWGSFPMPAATGGHSGGGIMVGDQGSQWVVAENNTVLGTTNYGMSIVCGSNNVVRNNEVVAANRLPDGSWLAAANVGLSMAGFQPWNQNCTTYSNNKFENNKVGWQRGPNSQWGYGRADWWTPAAGKDGNVFTGNTSIKSGEITLADEQAAYDRWAAKVATQGIRIGRNAGSNPTPTDPPPPTNDPTIDQLKQQIAVLQAQVTTLTNEKSTLTSTVAALQDQKTALQTEIDALKTKLSLYIATVEAATAKAKQ